MGEKTMRKIIWSLVVLGVTAAIVSGGASGSGGPVAGASPSRAQPARHVARHLRAVHYTVADGLLIDSVDIAAGKAMQAAASPDGLYERRTSQEWCGAALDAEGALVRHHSLSWATRVDHARDAESQKFQEAAKACG